MTMNRDRNRQGGTEPRTADMAEGLAITASLLCLVHYLFLPLALAWSPAFSRAFDLPFDLHRWIVLIAGPVSLMILMKAAKQNRTAVFATGLLGLGLMVLALVLPLTGSAEVAISSLGSILLALAHVRNWLARHPNAHAPG